MRNFPFHQQEMNLQKFLGRLAKAIPQKKRHLKTNFLTFAQILLISWSDGRGILKCLNLDVYFFGSVPLDRDISFVTLSLNLNSCLLSQRKHLQTAFTST
jgi:hypothetical protein